MFANFRNYNYGSSVFTTDLEKPILELEINVHTFYKYAIYCILRGLSFQLFENVSIQL